MHYVHYILPIYFCVHIIQQVYIIILLQYNGACTLFGVVFNQRLKMIYDHGGSKKERERERQKKNGENYVSRQRNKVYIYIYIIYHRENEENRSTGDFIKRMQRVHISPEPDGKQALNDL